MARRRSATASCTWSTACTSSVQGEGPVEVFHLEWAVQQAPLVINLLDKPGLDIGSRASPASSSALRVGQMRYLNPNQQRLALPVVRQKGRTSRSRCQREDTGSLVDCQRLTGGVADVRGRCERHELCNGFGGHIELFNERLNRLPVHLPGRVSAP